MQKTRSALITGITGQDGAYLAKLLLKKNYVVFGTFRRLSTPNFWRLSYLGIDEDVNYIPADLIDTHSIIEAIKISKPDEVYHLAAQSYVGTSFDQPLTSGEFSGLAVTRVLESVRLIDPQIKFYQASSSEIFGKVNDKLQSESSSFIPQSPYAAAKLYGYWMTKMYRDGYGLFASNGILFNHESPLRGLEFVTRKITNSVARIKLGLQNELRLGYLDSSRDWGFAPEYVEGMWKILQYKKPDDYVLSTGESHTVKEFVIEAFSYLDLKWQKYVKSDKKLYRILEVERLNGDSTKAKKHLKWEAKTKFKDLVKIMVDKDLKRWQDWQKGKRFPWDAVNYVDKSTAILRTRNK
jgi:GDPmannose 4,6-dehydratase